MRKVITAFLFAFPVAAAASDPTGGRGLDSAARQVPPPSEAQSAVSVADKPETIRFFNDPPLIAKEYMFGTASTVVAGALGFFIGSGFESAFYGSKAHKGTLSFTGIRYDNYKGAFWGGASGMLIGCALANYFTGETDEEHGSFFWTLVGTGLAQAGAMSLASAAGVNKEVGWVPFIPLIILPSAGGVLGFNLSRWLHDRKRESVIQGGTAQSSLKIHPPRIAYAMDSEGEGVWAFKAVNLSF